MPTDPERPSERARTEALGRSYGMQLIDLDGISLAPDALPLLSRESAWRLQALPVGRAENRVLLALADPSDVSAIAEVRLGSGLEVEPLVAVPSALRELIDTVWGKPPEPAPPQEDVVERQLFQEWVKKVKARYPECPNGDRETICDWFVETGYYLQREQAADEELFSVAGCDTGGFQPWTAHPPYWAELVFARLRAESKRGPVGRLMSVQNEKGYWETGVSAGSNALCAPLHAWLRAIAEADLLTGAPADLDSARVALAEELEKQRAYTPVVVPSGIEDAALAAELIRLADARCHVFGEFRFRLGVVWETALTVGWLTGRSADASSALSLEKGRSWLALVGRVVRSPAAADFWLAAAGSFLRSRRASPGARRDDSD